MLDFNESILPDVVGVPKHVFVSFGLFWLTIDFLIRYWNWNISKLLGVTIEIQTWAIVNSKNATKTNVSQPSIQISIALIYETLGMPFWNEMA